MRPRSLAYAGSLAALFVALSCSSTSTGTGFGNDGGAPEGSTAEAGDDAGKTLGAPITPPSQTGNAVVDRLGAAAASCGKQSMFTVPGGWEMVAVGDKGCVVWTPPGWVITGSFTGLATAMRDGSGKEGFVGIAGATQELACSAPALRDGVLEGYTQKGYTAMKVLWHHEQSDAFGGSAWPTGHTVFGMSVGGTPLVGYLWILATQTVVACDVVGLGFWEPVASIESDTCVLTQIINSVKCPSGGGPSCSDSDCNASCANGGQCDSNGNCECR